MYFRKIIVKILTIFFPSPELPLKNTELKMEERHNKMIRNNS
jgi:hypothetical protein